MSNKNPSKKEPKMLKRYLYMRMLGAKRRAALGACLSISRTQVLEALGWIAVGLLCFIALSLYELGGGMLP